MAEAHRKTIATYEDLRALPENVVGEIVDGDLFASPRPTSLHALAASNLMGEIGGVLVRAGGGGRGGWVVLIEPELHIDGQVMVPDLAAWRRERMPEIPDVPFFDLAPDWVCEVSSPSTAILDRGRKMPHYARAGVGLMWIVDPGAKTLEIFRLAPDGARSLIGVHGGDDKVRAEPFEFLLLDLAELWAR